MRIAQVAPLFESVPPRLYGGTERVVHWLTEELVAMGHEITLFASGDSETSARLVACCPRGLRLDRCVDPIAHHMLMLERIVASRDQFDIVHFHCDHLHFPLCRHLGLRHLTTLHGRLDLPDLPPLYDEFGDMPVVSISDAQRRPLPQARWVSTVHHGMPLDLLRPGTGDGGYLAFIGRISPEKRPDRAIDIAARAGCELRIAAKVDAVDQRYFEECIAPLIAQPHVEFVGEIGDADKSAFLGGARALLVPIDWPEPFGLVMIEAMACGTPVIAFPSGSVPEVVEDGVTGWLCADVEQAVAAVARLAELDRGRVRAEFERRFEARRMAQDYLRAYQRVLSGADHDDGHRPDPGSLLHPRHVA